MSPLGDIIRRTREEAGIGQRELAVRSRTSQGAVSRIENGLEEPSYERFTQIMRALGYAPGLELRRLAEHDAEPRQLMEQARKSPQERFDEGINWLRFLRGIPSLSPDDG